MNHQIMAAYREWLLQQPLYEIHTMEAHVAEFVSWFITNKVAAVEPLLVKAA